MCVCVCVCVCMCVCVCVIVRVLNPQPSYVLIETFTINHPPKADVNDFNLPIIFLCRDSNLGMLSAKQDR